MPRVLGLGKLALRRRLPLDGLRATEFASSWLFALPTEEGVLLLREAVRFLFGKLVYYGYIDVAGAASLALDALLTALDRLFALAGQNDTKFVTKVILEIYQPGVRIDLFRSCLREWALHACYTSNVMYLSIYSCNILLDRRRNIYYCCVLQLRIRCKCTYVYILLHQLHII